MNGEWANGANIFDQTGADQRRQDDEMWSDHPGGVQVVLCDSSVHFLDDADFDRRARPALHARRRRSVARLENRDGDRSDANN